MRIRSIKPEFWRSSDISKLSIEDRLLFVGLWSYVDDNGVGLDKLSAITADLFADDLERDAPETFARVSRGLQNLSATARIIRYEVDGTNYLSITNWGRHQRIDKPGKPRFPRPDAENAEIRDGLARVFEKVAPGTGEQGNRGTGEQSSSSDAEASDPGEIEAPEDDAFPEHIYDLCDHLAEAITRNGNKVGTVGARWHQAMDRLVRLDGYTPDQVRQVIDWSQQDEFWQGNILSAPKLREKFDQLKTRMLNERNTQSGQPQFMTAAERKLAAGENLIAKYAALEGQQIAIEG